MIISIVGLLLIITLALVIYALTGKGNLAVPLLLLTLAVILAVFGDGRAVTLR